MTSKMNIFDHFCKPLVEIPAPTSTPRSYILNGYGKCEFSIGYDPKRPQSEQVAQEKYFQFGNLIHIEHIPQVDENGTKKGKLPDWIGIILPPQTWDYGIIHVTAYQAESILAFRAMPYLSVKGTPKTVLQQMINIVHERASNIIFQPGILDDLPLTFPDDLRTNAHDHIQKLIKDSGMDWSVTGDINAKGNLDLFINLYQRKGIDTQLELTNTNAELKPPLLTVQGTPSNEVFGYSQAQTMQSRFTARAIHQASYDDYGPLQLNQVFIGKHDATSVYNSAQARASERGRPVKLINRTALDYQNTFDYLDVGNIVTVKDKNVGFNPNGGYGFEDKFRILSMDYNDLSNKVPLNIEVV